MQQRVEAYCRARGASWVTLGAYQQACWKRDD
ncbi:MAG: hypothetical protein KatS3mg131_2675 [Candidatus Tectimicrobiota bacterium]|nr:MAG: hypothetical protein KatS3mg131_2675 [Candidatus Tectomicrobia bacterium]